MMKSLTLAILALASNVAFGAPLADPSAEPEIQMLNKRAPATVFTKCVNVSRFLFFLSLLVCHTRLPSSF